MVIETSQPIAKVARELGIVEGTLGNWVNTYRREHTAEETPLTLMSVPGSVSSSGKPGN
jgi:transposase